MKKFVTSVVVAAFFAVAFLVGYLVTHETIPAGYVGYVYDRNAKGDNVIDGTSVINVERTGRISINPVTQEVLTYPTTIISKNWTRLEEGDNTVDMSMQVATKEGKNVDADIYISVRPIDVAKIIRSFGTKSFDSIIDNDIYGLAKGKLSTVTNKYSVYDIQASRSEIQLEATEILSEVLDSVYGVELVRFEIGTLTPPQDIQEKIDQKTNAQNQVELAKLERQRQDEVNQQIVDEQRAQSEKELIQRQTEADAAAYEISKAAEAELAAQEARVQTAELQVEQARLEKEAELERQMAFTDSYFRDKELDNERAAVQALNGSVQTIIVDGNANSYGALFGLDRILGAMS